MFAALNGSQTTEMDYERRCMSVSFSMPTMCMFAIICAVLLTGVLYVGFFICALYCAPPPCSSACSPCEPFAYRPYQTCKVRESGRAYRGIGHKNSTGRIAGATKLAQSKAGNLKGPPHAGWSSFFIVIVQQEDLWQS